MYDAQGNRTSLSDPDAGTILTNYDAFGKLLREVNAKGDTTSYLYDDIGRMIRHTNSSNEIYYSYLSDTSHAAFGVIDSIYNADNSLREIYSYDSDYGMLLSETRSSSAKTFTNTYTYDWLGRPLTRTYPSGFQTQFAYNGNGTLSRVTGEGLTLWQCNTANALGQVTSYSQGSHTTNVTYDSYGQLGQVQTGAIRDMLYDFDDMGNLSSRNDSISRQKEVFTYDELNRLTAIEYYDAGVHQPAYDFETDFDDCGNITSKTGISDSINYGEGSYSPHKLTSIENPDTTYRPSIQTIAYNCFNKVSSIEDSIPGGNPFRIDFTYGLGQQRIKTVRSNNGAFEQVKYFDIDYEEDSTSSGLKKYHYIHGGNGLTAIFVKEGQGNDTMYYVMTDHLGSLTTLVNATSNEVTDYSYNAWGEPRDADDWTQEFSGELFAGRGYTGHEHLEQFDLINMNGRVYDPLLGRFLSPDPFIQAPNYPNNYNRYTYALNNPPG